MTIAALRPSHVRVRVDLRLRHGPALLRPVLLRESRHLARGPEVEVVELLVATQVAHAVTVEEEVAHALLEELVTELRVGTAEDPLRTHRAPLVHEGAQ